MITNKAVLVELNISVWTARKLDRKVSEEIDTSKATRTRAGNYNKNLMAGSTSLESVRQMAGAIRTWHYDNTLPWSDAGARLLPMANFFDYKQQLSDYAQQFDAAVAGFLAEYDALVSAAAFKLGALFDRHEYPTSSEVRGKFRIAHIFTPVPDSGDFRVDVGDEAIRELAAQYNQHYEDKMQSAMRDAWQRLYDALERISDRLADGPTGRKRFWDSTITNATELCSLLTKLNVTEDPQLEQARKRLEKALAGITPETVRGSDEVRRTVKDRVDAILDVFGPDEFDTEYSDG